MLITEVVPKEYRLFTKLVYDSVDNGYKNQRTHRVNYLANEIDIVKGLILEILDKNKNQPFLIKEEKVFLTNTLALFKRKEITIKEYSNLVQGASKAITIRIIQIRNALNVKLKQKKFDVSPEDNEYLFSLENIIQQMEILTKESKNWDQKTYKPELFRKALIIFKNLQELIFSIALEDTHALPSISYSILNFDNLKLNITQKLVA